MKKMIAILLVVVMATTMVACGGNNDNTQQSNPPYLENDSNSNNREDETSKKDPSQYYGYYYFLDESCGIQLSYDDILGKDFFMNVVYKNGEEYIESDFGCINIGEKTLLDFSQSTYATLDIDKKGNIHLKLENEYIEGCNYDDDLIAGHPFELFGLSSAKELDSLSTENFLEALVQIEANCFAMTAESIINQYDSYSNGTTYRFPGKVVYVDNDVFFLQIADEEFMTNNIIVCANNGFTVNHDEKICVFGEGLGEETYDRIYENGNQVTFSTLFVDTGYIMRDGGLVINDGPSVPEYLHDNIFETYIRDESGGSSTFMSNVVTITENQLIGESGYAALPEKAYRDYTVNHVKIDFDATKMDYNTEMDNILELQISLSAVPLKKADWVNNETIQHSLSFDLNQYFYKMVVYTYTANTGTSLAYYYKDAPAG